jgi:CRP-like cAMP-binding protein
MERQPHCTVCGSEAKSVFCALAGGHLERLDREKSVRTYERGEAVFYAGNPPLAVYCVYSGRIKLYKTGRRGEEQVIRLLGAGEMTGYRALLANEPYAATAEAIERTVVCTISRQTLLTLVRESPDLALALLARMAQELRRSEDSMVSRTEDSVRIRAARLLLMLSGDQDRGLTSPAQISVPLRRAEMAQMIGTTPETLSRTLHGFASRGWLALSRVDIVVLDFAALRRIAQHT